MHQKALEVVFHSFTWQDVLVRTAFTIRAHRVENLGWYILPSCEERIMLKYSQHPKEQTRVVTLAVSTVVMD